MVCIEDAGLANGTEVNGFCEVVALLEEIFVMWLLVTVGAKVYAQVFVRIVGILNGDSDVGVVSRVAVLDADGDW